MKPTSVDLRKRVVAARLEDGQSMAEIAKRFRMPKGTVQNILERYRDAGTVVPKPQNPGRKRAISDEHLARLKQEVAKDPDATLAVLRERCGFTVSLVTVHNTLRREKITLKKSRCGPKSNAEPT